MADNEQVHKIEVHIALQGDDPDGLGEFDAHDLVKEALEHMGWELAHPGGRIITLVKVVSDDGYNEDIIFGDEDED